MNDKKQEDMSTKLLIIMMFIVFCLSSCKQNKRWDSASKIVSEWTGKEIKFSEVLSCISIERDTSCIDVQNDNFKIVLYVDSLGCTNCRLSLSTWKKIMKESDSVFIRKPEFVFIFQPKKRDEKELSLIFRNNGFSHPVFIDQENETDRMNKFPSKPEYQCFLLDKDNKVIMVGNPATNSGIWILYKRIITETETRVLTMKKGGSKRTKLFI